MKKIALVILVLILLAGAYFGYREYNKTKQNTKTTVSLDVGNGPNLKDEIIVSFPRPLQKIESPLSLTGKARGNWYFEASFPAEVVDANENTLGRGIMQADGDWMTTDFVPFSGEITFETPKTKTGSIIIRNDNPSGRPENEKKLIIPVAF